LVSVIPLSLSSSQTLLKVSCDRGAHLSALFAIRGRWRRAMCIFPARDIVVGHGARRQCLRWWWINCWILMSRGAPSPHSSWRYADDKPDDTNLDDDTRDAIEMSARFLYGLIHARYIVTSRGLQKMVS
jgi:hypothetical protein